MTGGQRVPQVPEPSATAHRYWDGQWATAQGRAAWSRPEEFVARYVPVARARGLARVLDVGCGVGRHANYLASAGFTVDAVDASAEGVRTAARDAEAANLDVGYGIAAFTGLPYPDGCFDWVLAWNVVYHGDGVVVRTAAAELVRVLRPGGVLLATMLSRRNANFGVGVETSPATFVQPDAPPGSDKGHPHHYADARAVLDLFPGLEPIELRDRDQTGEGGYHWEFAFERRP